jgi:hypothetical protein
VWESLKLLGRLWWVWVVGVVSGLLWIAEHYLDLGLHRWAQFGLAVLSFLGVAIAPLVALARQRMRHEKATATSGAESTLVIDQLRAEVARLTGEGSSRLDALRKLCVMLGSLDHSSGSSLAGGWAECQRYAGEDLKTVYPEAAAYFAGAVSRGQVASREKQWPSGPEGGTELTRRVAALVAKEMTDYMRDAYRTAPSVRVE